MNITVNWRIELPIKMAIEDGVSSVFNLKEGLIFELIKRPEQRYYDVLEVKYKKDVSDSTDLTDLSTQIKIEDKVNSEVGPEVNRFYFSLAKHSHLFVQNIFNGEDLIVPYNIAFLDDFGQPLATISASGGATVINSNTAEKIKYEFNMNEEDLVEQLLFHSQNYLNMGFIDMALINSYMALEVYVKKRFTRSAFLIEVEFEMFKAVPDRQFMRKYLAFGPYLKYKRSFEDERPEDFKEMILLDHLRNKIAHEGTALSAKVFESQQADEIYRVVELLIDTVEETINWLVALDSLIKFHEKVIVNSEEPRNSSYKGKEGLVIDIKWVKGKDDWKYSVLIDSQKGPVLFCNSKEVTGTKEFGDVNSFT